MSIKEFNLITIKNNYNKIIKWHLVAYLNVQLTKVKENDYFLLNWGISKKSLFSRDARMYLHAKTFKFSYFCHFYLDVYRFSAVKLHHFVHTCIYIFSSVMSLTTDIFDVPKYVVMHIEYLSILSGNNDHGYLCMAVCP